MHAISELSQRSQDRTSTFDLDADGFAASSEELFNALISHVPAGVLVTDVDGACTYANERALEFAGLSPAQALGLGWMHAIHPDDAERVQSNWAAASGAGQDFAIDFRFLRADGTICWLSGNAAAVRDGEGLLVGWIGICADMTESMVRQVEERKQQEDRAVILDRMLRAGANERMLMATELHDGPIQHLSAFGYTLDRLERRLKAGELDGCIELLRTVRTGLAREIEMLRQMTYELRPLVLDERGIEPALREYAADFEHRTGIPCAFSGGIGEGRPDSHSEWVLYRVTQEALSNVARYSKAEHATVELRELPTGVSLAISDDGIGFDLSGADELATQGRFGLLTIRDHVETAGGETHIETAPTGGTRIEVSIPTDLQPRRGASWIRPRDESDRSREAESAEAIGSELPTVLLVDDDPLLRRVLGALLVDGGFTIVAEATNGAEAVDLARYHRPDLVLMDVRMPVMDGPEAARAIRAENPAIEIVLLSGSGDQERAAAYLDAGVFALVAKGGAAGVICETLLRAWRHAGHGDGPSGGPSDRPSDAASH